jgi:glycosyltransferase involved in cell wall biosynthesis
MTRILFLGDLQGTGFGSVTFDLGRALLATDDVRFCTLNERALVMDDLPEPFASRTLQIGHPNGWLGFVNSEEETLKLKARIESMFEGSAWEDGWTPEAVIMVGDAASVKGSPPVVLKPERLPGFHYVPIEGVDLPPRWAMTWQRGWTPVAMSEFGADQIATIWRDRPPVIYHGVNTTDFWPVSHERPITLRMGDGLRVLRSKDDCRRFFGGDPRHLWLFRADRNMPRKRYPSLLRSMAPILAKHRDAFLVYHCATIDQGGDLEDEKSKYLPHIAAKMVSTGFHDAQDGAPREILNALYNAADIYVSTGAEGFGLTIAEAMACGVPAVGLHFSSVPEVIGNLSGEPGEGAGGVTVPVGMLMENIYAHFWAGVDEEAMTAAVDRLVTKPKRRRELGWMAHNHISKTFTWEQAAAQFSELARAAVGRELVAA